MESIGVKGLILQASSHLVPLLLQASSLHLLVVLLKQFYFTCSCYFLITISLNLLAVFYAIFYFIFTTLSRCTESRCGDCNGCFYNDECGQCVFCIKTNQNLEGIEDESKVA